MGKLENVNGEKNSMKKKLDATNAVNDELKRNVLNLTTDIIQEKKAHQDTNEMQELT